MKGWRNFLRSSNNLLGLLITLIFILIALAAPLLAPPADPAEFSPFRSVPALKGNLPTSPNDLAVFGTIATGVRSTQLDVYYTVIWGARGALIFGLVVTLVTALIGVVIGAFSAWSGGWAGAGLMRITDAFLAFPLIAGVVILQQLAYLGSGQAAAMNLVFTGQEIEPSLFQRLLLYTDPVVVAFILFLWMPYARLTHTMVLQIKDTEFMEAARAMGAGRLRILLRHLVPNSISPALVLAARDIGLVVVLQAGLTYIGLIDNSAWGSLLAIGRRWIIGTGGSPLTYWWTFLPATLAIIFFGVGWNLLGDGLNDWLNPRSAA